jgi:molybdate transport system substrate-binding protein
MRKSTSKWTSRWTKFAAAAIAGLLSAAIVGTTAKAAEIVLVTTAAVEQIMLGLIPSFEKATGNTVKMSVDGTPTAVGKVRDGTYNPDLVLLSPEALGELAVAGKVTGGTITPAFRSRVGVAVRAGAPKPDISTPEAFKKAMLDAKSIGHSIGPSGDYFSTVLIQKLGIADALKPKITVVRGMPVAAAVAKGQVEIGIHQIAELMPIPGIDIVGPLPPELNTTLIYATGIATHAKQPDAAGALVKYLSVESSVPVIRKNGKEPAL